jgi:hypothetical protein
MMERFSVSFLSWVLSGDYSLSFLLTAADYKRETAVKEREGYRKGMKSQDSSFISDFMIEALPFSLSAHH